MIIALVCWQRKQDGYTLLENKYSSSRYHQSNGNSRRNPKRVGCLEHHADGKRCTPSNARLFPLCSSMLPRIEYALCVFLCLVLVKASTNRSVGEYKAQTTHQSMSCALYSSMPQLVEVLRSTRHTKINRSIDEHNAIRRFVVGVLTNNASYFVSQKFFKPTDRSRRILTEDSELTVIPNSKS